MKYNVTMRKKITYEEQFSANVAAKIKECRLSRRYSLREAGALVGVSGQCMKYYESGRSAVSLPVFFAIMTAYDYDPIQVLTEIKNSG